MIQNLKTIETMLKKKEPNFLIKNLTNYLYKKIQELDLIDVVMCFDATSLYPSAMYDNESVYPKIGRGFAFKVNMNFIYVEIFSNQTFNQDGNESAILKIKCYNPRDLIFEFFPVKEKGKNIEINRMRNVILLNI